MQLILYRCNSDFSVFQTFQELRFIILFWDICDLLDRVCRPRCWFVSDKPKFIQYCWMLLNSKKSLKCKILNLKCFSKMAKRELVDARPSNATRRWRSSKGTKPELVVARPSNAARRWWSSKVTKRDFVVASTQHHRARLLKCYPRPPCAPSFVKSRMLRPLQTHFLLFQQIFFVLVCIHQGNPRVPPRVLASGPKPCGGNYYLADEHELISLSTPHEIPH